MSFSAVVSGLHTDLAALATRFERQVSRGAAQSLDDVIQLGGDTAKLAAAYTQAGHGANLQRSHVYGITRSLSAATESVREAVKLIGFKPDAALQNVGTAKDHVRHAQSYIAALAKEIEVNDRIARMAAAGF